jgi:2'-5' RNA ligase
VACDRVADVTHVLQVTWRPFDLVFGHAELWPNGVALLLPQTVPERLLQLHAALHEALHKADLPTERRAFRPHVTLARRAQGATPPSQGPELHWRVRTYALVESQRDASSRYLVLQRYA